MDARRKKPLWPWIVATVVAVPVLYVATAVPVFLFRVRHPDELSPLAEKAARFYSRPILRMLTSVKPRWIQRVLDDYVDFLDFI